MTDKKSSMKIQEVQSPGGIKAWLVEEHSVPLIAIRFGFAGGNAQDPADKPGVAHFLTTMLDEGAGELTAEQFQERAEDIAMRMSYQDNRDTFYGSFQTLTQYRDQATDLLRLALTKPRFDAAAVERMKAQLLATLSFELKNPNRVAGNAWLARAYPGHPYGRPSKGTLESIAAITASDLEAYRKRIFARSKLKITVVGDINAKDLGLLLDKVFGDLPADPELAPVAKVTVTPQAKLEVIDLPVPQSVVVFGANSIARHDPDFMTAFVMNEILGGGGFSSRFMEEVREKRGLAYGIYSYLQYFDGAAYWVGHVATKNDKVAETIAVVRGELKRMAEGGPSQKELDGAKAYLTGSYALRFDTSAKIATQLLAMQLDNLGIDYVQTRNAKINAITLEDIKRVAKRLLGVGALNITVVGRPKHLGHGG
ncbi:MAG: insulinase family protein [Hyphomicrobiaceae bacterium]|nr:insulinase family protein [Hyphomicrobiaceae bacterium]